MHKLLSGPRWSVAVVSLAVLAAPAVYQLAAQSTTTDVVLRPGRAAVVAGRWAVVADPSAADGVAVQHPDSGAAKLAQALAAPTNYFELTFDAQANVPYRLWIRGKAQSNRWSNDSVFVQFAGSENGSGAPAYRIGTTAALEVNLEECNDCGLSNWGWQDTGWGAGVLGPEVQFTAAGPQRMRVQTREDGFTIDQVVLSPQRYFSTAPGPPKNDATIVPLGGTVQVVRRPYLQQMSATRVIVVWATRESGTPAVRVGTGSSARTVTGVSRLVPRASSGLTYDYVHHEVTIAGLSPATAYDYAASVGGTAVASARFRTAPATGTGTVSFIAFGDSGTGSTAQRQLATRMAADTANIALHAGDIVYGSSSGVGDASYFRFNTWFFDIYAAWLSTRPFYPTEGNHDSRLSNNNGAAYLDAFTLPSNGGSASHRERYYSFDYGPVHFVALDTEFTFQDATRRAEQVAWLEADLAATAQPWKVAFFHRSPFSAGAEHGSDLAVRAAFAPLFEQYGVQLAISAHEHDYERSLPWRESGTGSPVTYVVTGGGGAPLYPAGRAAWTDVSASRHHYLRADADACTLTLRAIGTDGGVFDSSTLSRCTQPPPPPPAAAEIVLYAAAARRSGGWIAQSDATAAGGQLIRHPDAKAAKLASPLAQPTHYFELTFDAEQDVPYRLWIRANAQLDDWGNDSAFVQFDHAVTAAGAAQFRIGTTSATTFNLEECSGCGLAGWGWEDNGWGRNVLGPQIVFSQAGAQTIRIQTREDGLSIDQIVLSPSRYLTRSPGALKNDTTILARP